MLTRNGTTVHSLDVSLGSIGDEACSHRIYHRICDITSWSDTLAAFDDIGRVDFAIASAGVSRECDYFVDGFTSGGALEEPKYQVLDVNLRAVLNFAKLSLSKFKRQGPGSRLLLTSSATAYSPEQSLLVYSATELALLGLVRALRSTLPHSHGATVNAVALAAIITCLLRSDLAAPIIAAGAPGSSAEHAALAIAHSLTATQDHQVERYGRDSSEAMKEIGSWNCRVIMTLEDIWTEIEEPLGSLRSQWLGAYNTEATAFQQQLTDFRSHVT